jgi:fermentation-respiration switch protein FrsA (DUF1100 family)
MDFRVGGRERLKGKWKTGMVTQFDATYFDILPGERIVYAYEMQLDVRKISVSLATFEFKPLGSGTKLIMTEQGAFLNGYDDNGTFPTRYGIGLAADVYMPKGKGNQRLPAIVVGGPFGAVKEQAAGLYAQTLAERGFVNIAFDPSFNGESGGETRGLASPEIFTDDFSAAADFLGMQPYVDRNRIGLVGVCGSGGFGLTAASVDKRFKAVATAAMYDISRQYAKGMGDSQSKEDRAKRLEALSLQRWKDMEKGTPAPMPYLLPDTVDANTHPVVREFYDYYAMPRGFHPRARNSDKAGNFTDTSFMAFMNFPQLTYIGEISPRPVLRIAGGIAHSRYFSEDAFKALGEQKELVIVPGANHVDLYDRMDKIPFDKLETFFRSTLR